MFECSNCALRYIRAIGSETTTAQYILRKHPALTPRLDHHLRRRYANAAILSEVRDDPNKNTAWAGPLVSHGKSSKERPNGVPIRNMRALRMEMQYLHDPVKFAKHVHYTLRCGDLDKALELCRMASKSMNCVVAWNHTINWLMAKDQPNEAIKVYNEMKKRAQFPDSYTYLLLLRGFPQHRSHHGMEVKKEMVVKAVSIYNSMSSPTSKVKPSIIHTNATLRVCSLARDMDALWGIVSQLPESGPNSANCVTYTILLSAIRYSSSSDQVGLSDQQVSQLRQRAVDEGRRIWQDIVVRWRGGEVLIDEELVCEMGNLLLVSKRIEDWDDVLNLVQQTTDMKRLLPSLGSPGRHTEHVPVFREAGEEEVPGAAQEDDGWTSGPAKNAFKSVETHERSVANSQKSGSPAWVRPGNAILSVIMGACTNMRSSKALIQYWHSLVKDYGLAPDLANYHALLRFLRINRDSSRAASVIQEISDQGIEPRNQTFRIALSVCARNPKNPNVLGHARSIVAQMYELQGDPDIPTLESYLDLARTLRNGIQISSVLDQLEPTMDKLGSRVNPEIKTNRSDNNTAASFFRFAIGAIDTLCQDGSVSKEDTIRWKAKRIELDRLIGQATNNPERQGQHESRQNGSTQRHMSSMRSVHKRDNKR